MKGLFALAGVDYVQWKAISRTLLRSDFRPPGQSTDSYSLRTAGGFALIVLTYGLFGLGAAIVIFMNADVLLTGTVTLTYVGMLVITALLSQHTSSITSTTDYAILAPHPVSSNTFLAVRLANVLFHTSLLTTLMACLPVAAYIMAHGVNVGRGLAAAIAMYACSFAITFTMVALYGTLLNSFGAARLQKVFSYAQMLVGILAYGGVVLILQLAGRSAVAAAAMPREPWLLLIPPAWFASYIEIAVGLGDWNSWSRAAISVVVLGGLAAVLRGPLGMSYAERLGELSATTGEPSASEQPRHAWLFTRDEPRAVALLVRAHFRHDLRVRLGVLAIVPLTLLYMFMGIREGGSGDPFTSADNRSTVDLVALAVLFFPTMVVQQFSATDAFRAAWIYFATPANRTSLIVALKNVIVTFFFFPYLVFLAVLYTWRFSHAGHALVHTAFLGLIGYLALELGFVIEPRLPFALPPKKAANGTALIVWMLIAVVGGNLLLSFLQDWVYDEWWRVAAFAFGLLGCIVLLNSAIRARSLRRYQSFEFS